jgi:hypothetical protein
MSILRKAFRLYVDASLHVALAVAAFAYVTAHVFHFQSDPILTGFIFSSTVLSYNFMRYLPAGTSPFKQPAWMPGQIVVISTISLAVSVITLFLLPWNVTLAALLLGLITLAYAIPLSDGKQNLRNVYGIKIGVIAAVWTGTTVVLPVLNQTDFAVDDRWLGLIGEAVQRFLLVCVLILPFDIRDYRSDAPTMGTVPQLIGVRQSKALGITLLCVCLLIEWMQVPGLSYQLLVFILLCLISAGAVWRSMIRQSPYFASFWVEGIPVLWALLLLAENLF